MNMRTIDIAALLDLPDAEFIARLWASLNPSGHEVPPAVVLAVHACESRSLVVVRAWIAAIGLDRSVRSYRLAGPGTRAANLANRLPLGLPVLRACLQLLGNLTGRRALRLAQKSQLLAQRLSELERDARRLQGLLDALERRLNLRDDPGLLAEDLTRRIDLMTWDIRQAIEAAALSADERRTLADAALRAAGQTKP